MTAKSDVLPSGAKPPARAARVIALDVFRGATVAAMLVVNNPGSWSAVYAPLDHAKWNGWTFTDMIFPFFLWIVGVSMTLSFERRRQQGHTEGDLMRHALMRAAIIFGLGLFLGIFPFGLLPAHHLSFSTLRIMGVLQRIALCYAAASAICLTVRWRGQLAATGVLLVGYALLLKFAPVPGYGAGLLEPRGNFAWWIDSHLLAGHTWSGAPTPGFDPEGLLSTLPAIASTLLGALAGRIMLDLPEPRRRVKALLIIGLAMLVLGWALGLWLPINKNLWTSSYALFMAGWASLILAILDLALDRAKALGWTRPFVVFGMNAITAFMLSGLLGRLFVFVTWSDAAGQRVVLKTFLFTHTVASWGTPEFASLCFALGFLAVIFALVWLLYRRGWSIKI